MVLTVFFSLLRCSRMKNSYLLANFLLKLSLNPLYRTHTTTSKFCCDSNAVTFS